VKFFYGIIIILALIFGRLFQVNQQKLAVYAVKINENQNPRKKNFRRKISAPTPTEASSEIVKENSTNSNDFQENIDSTIVNDDQYYLHTSTQEDDSNITNPKSVSNTSPYLNRRALKYISKHRNLKQSSPTNDIVIDSMDVGPSTMYTLENEKESDLEASRFPASDNKNSREDI
jgi:hypothetical protein